MKTPINWIDSYLQASPNRLIIKPTHAPIPTGISTSLNATGGTEITVTWSYTQGITPAMGFILYATNSFVTPTIENSTPFQVDSTKTSFTFSNIRTDINWQLGIAAYTIVNDIMYVGDIVSPISSPNWRYTATTPNYSGNLNGVSATSITSSISNLNSLIPNINAAWQYASDATSDNIISAGVEKQWFRTNWEQLYQYKVQLDSLGDSLGISHSAFDATFQTLSNLLNGGTWTSGVPYHIQDSQLNSSLFIGGIQGYIISCQVELTALIKALTEKSSQLSTWNGVSNVPGNVQNTSAAGTQIGNINFNQWSNPANPPDGWNLYASATCTRDTSHVRSGKYSVKFITSSGNQAGIYVYIPNVNIKPNTLVTGEIELFIESISGSGVPLVFVALYDGTDYVFSQATASTATGVWQKVAFSARTVNPTISATIYLLANWNLGGSQYNFIGTVYFDNIDYNLNEGLVIDNKQQLTSDLNGTISANQTSIAAINPTTGNLNSNTVTQLQIASGAVTAAKTALSAIDPSSGNLTANSVTTNNIVAGSITGIKIAAGEITGDKLYVNALNAMTMDTSGYVRAQGIRSFTVSGYSGTVCIIGNESLGASNGVVGLGTTGSGVHGWCYGYEGVSGVSVSGTGVYGFCTSGYGVRGSSSTSDGVRGVTSSSSAYGGSFSSLKSEGKFDCAGTATFSSTVNFSSLNLPSTVTKTGTAVVSNLNSQFFDGLAKANVVKNLIWDTTIGSTVTGTATATFNQNNKPGSSSSNLWLQITIGGTQYYLPIWG